MGLQKKSLADYMNYMGSNKNTTSYETTTDYLINHIQKTYNKGDAIATAIEKGTDQDSWMKPQLIRSTDDDPEIRDMENKQYRIKFKAELEVYMRQNNTYEENKVKAYAFF